MFKFIKILFHISTCGIFWLLFKIFKKKNKTEIEKLDPERDQETIPVRDAETMSQLIDMHKDGKTAEEVANKLKMELEEVKRYFELADEIDEEESLKEKERFRNELLEIPGVTKTIAEYIMKEYDFNRQKLGNDTIENILKIPKISKKQAEAIKKRFS